MRKFLLLAAAALIAAVSGCTKDDPEVVVNNDGSFVGDVVVAAVTEEHFTDPGIKVNITKNADGTYDFLFNQVKFASAMPVRLDITVPGVTIGADGTVSGNEIIPLAMGGEYPKFKVTELKGKLGTDKNGQYKTLQFSLFFGSYATSYSGDFSANKAE